MAGEEVYPTIGGTPALGTLGGSIPPFYYLQYVYDIRLIVKIQQPSHYNKPAQNYHFFPG